MELHLSLPGSLSSWIEEEATLGGYASAADYIQEVLRKEQQEQQRKLRAEIEQKLLAALDSGDPIDVTPEFWEARRQELKKRLERQGKAEGA
jgi:antitoxin ParD1/3/4